MGIAGRLTVLFFGIATMVACSEPPVSAEPGVLQVLARDRAARISNLHYRLQLDIPADIEAPIPAGLEIRFEYSPNGQALQLDFRERPDRIEALSVNGSPVAYQLSNEHIVILASDLQPGENLIQIGFQAGESALNRNPDYLYTLFVPDRARTVFPLFDQPDLKARYDLVLTVPAGWRAMSAAPVAEVIESGQRREYRFQTSDLVSSYLFSFVAGAFDSVTREVDGRQMTLFHRETDQARLARNLDQIFALHARSLAWMEAYTGIEYPFRKFDFALIPSFQYGGMEHVGAIQYRSAHLLLEESPSQMELLGRAQLIAHETAHMWFGNLVTMAWFDDVWTKEVFANFMADKIVNPSFPEVDHELSFLVGHYPPAYAVDRSEGANPIRQVLPNLNEAGQMYGSIIYHKAPIMMRQLEEMVGPEVFQAGMREYLKTFAHGNATWPELIAILDARSDQNLAAWSEVWVNTARRPEFRLLAGADPGPRLQQVDPAGEARIWSQRFQVSVWSGDEPTRHNVLADGPSVALPPPLATAADGNSLFSSDGYGYGLFPVDMALFSRWSELSGLERAVQLINAWENLLAGRVAQVEGYFSQLLSIAQTEPNQLVLELALGQLQFAYNSLLSDSQRARQQPLLETALWQACLAQAERARTRLFFLTYASLASSSQALQRLRSIWSGELSLENLVLEEEDLLKLVQVLAIRMPSEADTLIAWQLERTGNPDRRRRLEFIAPSLAADGARRDAFFASLAQVENRHTEPWVSEALANLHHPSRVAASEKYLLPSLQLLQEIQATGDIFFPTDWLRASLGNYRSDSAVATVRAFLDQRPDYNPQLRMKILQAADPLFRANRIQRAQRPPLADQS